jgi:hypothetical protein
LGLTMSAKVFRSDTLTLIGVILFSFLDSFIDELGLIEDELRVHQ